MAATALKKYSVVEFTKDNTIEVIPSSWMKADRTFAHWPRFKSQSQYLKLVREGKEPDKTWELLDIRFFKTTGILLFTRCSY